MVWVRSLQVYQGFYRWRPLEPGPLRVLGLTDIPGVEFVSLGSPFGASVVMPGMVKTAMHPIGTTIEPSPVGTNIVDAIRRGGRYVFTDDQSSGEVEDRLRAILAVKAAVDSSLPGGGSSESPLLTFKRGCCNAPRCHRR